MAPYAAFSFFYTCAGSIFSHLFLTQIVRLVITNTKLFLLLFAVFKELHKICNFDFVQPIFECHHLHLKFGEPSHLSSTQLTDYISINNS
jgi:hypothetical protein